MSALFPFLNIGVTVAFLRASGYELLCILKFRMTAKCLEITGAETFRYFALMPSMPVALLILRFWSSFKIKDSVIMEMENSGLLATVASL